MTAASGHANIAEAGAFVEYGKILRSLAPLTILSTTLGGCSYSYDLLVVARDGGVSIVVDPKSNQQPPCLRQIKVVAEGDTRAKTEPGDDASRVGYGTFWFESVDYEDDCLNEFPLRYGGHLKGRPQKDLGLVKAKPLLRGVVYTVGATTGATGYGGGRFLIHTDGRIENLGAPVGSQDTAGVEP